MMMVVCEVQCVRGGFCAIIFCFTCFAYFHFSFRVPTFPKMPFHDPPGEQQRVCCAQLLVSCVGRSSESIVRSSERLVKRKSCSPDSQTSTCLFSASVGVSAHCSWFLPACFVNIGPKWRLEREADSEGAGTKPKHFPLIFKKNNNLNVFFYQTLLNLEKAF